MTTPIPPEPVQPPVPVPADKTFTQADIDRIVTERVSRERGKFADYDDLKSKASQFDELAEKSRTEGEKAVEAARKEGFTEAQQKANDRYLKAKVHALAAKDLADPADAVRLLDLAQFKPDADGEFDDAAIKAAVGQLMKDKPYLAAKPSGFQGSGDGGARTGGSRPAQVTDAELKTMNAKQILKARQEGRLDSLLGG